jgi:Family of unknown function (DUF6920)
MSRAERIAGELWLSGPGGERAVERGEFERLPAAARLYLQHAIAPGTPLASAARLRMRGEIKLRRWLPFTAEQVVHRARGFIWRAAVRMNGLTIRGFDRLVDGEGEMRWKLLGLFPVMTASGPDISRSAAGRFVTESAWLPSILCGEDVSWTAAGPLCAVAHCKVFGEPLQLTITLAERGQARSLKLARWGNPEGGPFCYADFGAVAEEERTFAGFTVPSRIRAGWHFGTDRFARDGEFFRATIEEAVYR